MPVVREASAVAAALGEVVGWAAGGAGAGVVAGTGLRDVALDEVVGGPV